MVWKLRLPIYYILRLNLNIATKNKPLFFRKVNKILSHARSRSSRKCGPCVNIKILTNVSAGESIAFYLNYIIIMGRKCTSNDADLV